MPAIAGIPIVKIGMVSLGCPKTLVDSEIILGKLTGAAYELTHKIEDCDVALLNTCTFIQDAQKESIDRILELIELKKRKQIKAVVVMGCMVQRFPEELRNELTEVDAFIGSGDYSRIPEVVEKVSRGKKFMHVGEPGYLSSSQDQRVALTPLHYRYIKISEGCDHICTFCTIPSFRGKHRSRSIEDILIEAHALCRQGARELLLTGQDTTYFGKDTSGEFLLPELIRAMDSVKSLEWFRLLYAYPACLTEEMMKAMRDSKKMCHYLDMPLQHASDRMLQAMKRGITQRRTYDLIRKFRSIVPDLTIRTTFIVGFPGETDQDFQELLDFISGVRFERVGIFTYSQESGTPAAELPDQVPEKIKKERFKAAMLLQQQVSREHLKRFVGQNLKVLIEKKRGADSYEGRSYMDAPEIDGAVRVESGKLLETGQFYSVKITGSREYDLLGCV